MAALPYILAAVVGYFLGALPFGYWVAAWHGVDILKTGSGNPGATNVKRVVGKGAGNLVFALDFLKGVAATAWVFLLREPQVGTTTYLALVGLVAAILGHSFSPFIGFRGGKGVATTLGGAVWLMPVPALIAAILWVVIFYTTRYVSVASIALALALPVAASFRYGVSILFYFAIAIALFVVVRHRENIVRLIKGTENRFAPKNAARQESTKT